MALGDGGCYSCKARIAVSDMQKFLTHEQVCFAWRRTPDATVHLRRGVFPVFDAHLAQPFWRRDMILLWVSCRILVWPISHSYV